MASERDRLQPDETDDLDGAQNDAHGAAAGRVPSGGARSQSDAEPVDSESAVAVERLTSGLTLFSTRRPQNFVAGVSSGLKNVTRGVLAGTASLVALPVMGYQSDGWKGAAKNFGLGIVSCVGLSVGGAVSGAVQVVRGAINTPEAVRETLANEKMWHHGKRAWMEVRLQSDWQSVPVDDTDIVMEARRRHIQERPAAPQGQAAASSATGRQSLYEVLEVPRTASVSEVRKAYAKMALKHHPDKNVGDPHAAERFKAINEAYRVLSDPPTRSEYDRTGRQPGDSGHTEIRLPGLHLHPLQELLGGETFLPWIGHLRLAVKYMNSDYTFEEAELEEWQRRRVLRVTQHLIKFLGDIDTITRTEGGARARAQHFSVTVRELFAANFGREIAALVASRIHLAAMRYKSAAEGSVVARGTAIVEDCRQSVVSVGNSATTVIKALRQMQSQRQLTADDTVPMLLQFAESDIIDTVDTATDMVLHDQSVSRDERWDRMLHLLQFVDFVFHQLNVSAPPRRLEPAAAAPIS